MAAKQPDDPQARILRIDEGLDRTRLDDGTTVGNFFLLTILAPRGRNGATVILPAGSFPRGTKSANCFTGDALWRELETICEEGKDKVYAGDFRFD